ncbi:MAG: alpha/beta fold hydrolase, partial [Chloroflexi bacterium]|nr:alpha/beta fold hydrolase [Chloroflexota bacterium]
FVTEVAFRLRVPVTPTVALSGFPRGLSELPGTPFLLVHGLASNARLWDGVAEELVRLGHPSIAIDLRGHGRAAKTDDGYDFGTLATDLVAVIDEMDIETPIAVGQSWGGNVVMELAARHPDRIRGVVGVDGGTIELSAQLPEWQQASTELAPPDLLGTPVTEVEAWIRRAHPDWPESGIEGTLANFQVLGDGTILPRLSREHHMKILRELWEHHPARLYPQIRVPVLLQVAAPAGEDATRTALRRASVDAAQLAIGRCSVEWFSPADHDLHAQFPERCARSLAAFATSIAG